MLLVSSFDKLVHIISVKCETNVEAPAFHLFRFHFAFCRRSPINWPEQTGDGYRCYYSVKKEALADISIDSSLYTRSAVAFDKHRVIKEGEEKLSSLP